MYSGLIIFGPIGLVCGQKAVLASTTSLFHRHSVGLCNSGFLDYLCPFVYTFCSKKTICVQSGRRMQMSSWRKSCSTIWQAEIWPKHLKKKVSVSKDGAFENCPFIPCTLSPVNHQFILLLRNRGCCRVFSFPHAVYKYLQRIGILLR